MNPSTQACPGAPARIAIIGMGPCGLTLLERLLALARQRPAALVIEVFDPQPPGSGQHACDQPDYLMLNTMAGQLSVFPALEGTRPQGPTFLEWCSAQGLGLSRRGHVREGGQGTPISHGDFVPRKLLGRYLRDSFALAVRGAPPQVSVRHHAQAVMQCRPLDGGRRFALGTSGGSLEVDAVFLALGHTGSQPASAATAEGTGGVARIAWTPGAIDGLGARHHVAVAGLGLTAMDVVAGLTEGRGGCYRRAGGRLRYQRSGLEPTIWLYSSTGLPFHARPRWYPGEARPAGPTVFLTRPAIDALRAGAQDAQLDFDAQVLPLLCDEMRAAYYRTCASLQSPAHLAGDAPGEGACGEVEHLLATLLQPARRHEALARLAEWHGAFEPSAWLATARWAGPAHDYENWFRQCIEVDLAQSRLGLGRSPLKAALEVWRQVRDVLRHAVDHGGLRDASAGDFYRRYAALSNRLVGGPQSERHQDLLALLEEGVVRMLPPPANGAVVPVVSGKAVDCVVAAQVEHSGLAGTRSPLLADLLARSEIRPVGRLPISGIDTDALGRPLRRDGSVQRRMWAFGPNVEGATFYNHYVATPDPQCRLVLDAQAAARDCLTELGR